MNDWNSGGWTENSLVAFRRIKEANEKEGTKYLTRAEMKKGMVKDGKTKLSKPEKAAQKGMSDCLLHLVSVCLF